MKRDAFFERIRDWSIRKHRLLGKYLPPFSAKLGSRNPLIYCIDGFAGVGKYGDDAIGSPLIMAKLVDTCASWSRPVNIKIINIEAKPAHYAQLVENTIDYVRRGVVENLKGKFGVVVPEILSKIGPAPALFFVDPYGPTKIPFDDLAPILKRVGAPTELIINFDADGLRRLGDRIQKNVTTARGLKGALTTVGVVTRILGSDAWQPPFEAGTLTSEQREELLTKTYRRSLAAHNFKVVSYPVRKALGKRAEYYLIFCTRHFDGISLWNDFICEEDDLLRAEAAESINPGSQFLFKELEPLNQAQTNRREALRPLIVEYLRSRRTTTRGEIKRSLIPRSFGKFHARDYNAILQDLVNSDIVGTQHGRKRFNDDQPLTFKGTQR